MICFADLRRFWNTDFKDFSDVRDFGVWWWAYSMLPFTVVCHLLIMRSCRSAGYFFCPQILEDLFRRFKGILEHGF